LRSLGATSTVAIVGLALTACGVSTAVPAPTTAPTTAPPVAAPTTAAAATTAPAAAPTTASAAATATPQPAAKASLTIQFWNPANDKLGKKIIADIVDNFNKQSTAFQAADVVVESSNHYTKYVTAIASGQPPDSIMTYDYTPIITWSSQSLIIPLDPYGAQAGVKEADYFPIAWQMINFNGHLWGFLQEFDYNILAWNKDLFTAAGLDPEKPPKTTDEMDQMAAKLLKKKPDGSLEQIPFAPWITGSAVMWAAIWGGSYFDNTKGEYTIVTDPNVKSLEWYLKYSDLLGGPDKVQTFTKLFTGDQTPFYAGQMAMESMGEYIPITMPELAPKIKYGADFPPTGPGVPYGTGQTDGGNVFVIPKGAKNIEQSVAFIKYMAGPDPVLKWNVEENNIPPVVGVAYSPEFLKQVPLMARWVDLLKENKMVPPIISPVVDQFMDDLNLARDQVIYKKATPKAALTELDQKVQKAVADYKKAHPGA
jgi:multiple sugar transport system substrate-binding protein